MMLDRRDQMTYEIGMAVLQIGLVLCRHLLDHPELMEQFTVCAFDQEVTE